MRQQSFFDKQDYNDGPLASRLRPRTLEEFVGQRHLEGKPQPVAMEKIAQWRDAHREKQPSPSALLYVILKFRKENAS